MARQTRSRGRRADYDWEGAFIASTALNAGAAVQFELFLSDSAETLVRVRGMVAAWLRDSAPAAGDQCVVSWGLMVAPTGSTIAVTPGTDPGANWFWHQFQLLSSEFAVAATYNDLLASQRDVVDNKAMRRLREDEAVFLVVENSDATGAPVVTLSAALRVLTAR